MTEVHYCAAGCTRRDGDTSNRVITEGASNLCPRCETRLHDWLAKIPDTFALLPNFIEHGTVERNPDSKQGKATTAGAPMRLDIIDLLDTRRGRKWQGLEPTEDRRGVIGTLLPWVDVIAEGKAITNATASTVATACSFLNKHHLWAAEQDWAGDFYDDVRTLNRTLSDAVGEYRQKPVGKCHVPGENESPCGGNLFANTYGGVHCTRCSAAWDAAHLRQLGLAQAQETVP